MASIVNDIPSINLSIDSTKHVFANKIFAPGVFKLNGTKFKIDASDSLAANIRKINAKKHLTGVEAQLVQNKDSKPKIILKSSSLKTLHIQDYDNVLRDLYKKKLLGTGDQCLIQAVDFSGKSNNITLKYEVMHRPHFHSFALLSEENHIALVRENNVPHMTKEPETQSVVENDHMTYESLSEQEKRKFDKWKIDYERYKDVNADRATKLHYSSSYTHLQRNFYLRILSKKPLS